MHWDSVIRRLAPYVVRIDTPSGTGTGYLCAYNEDKTFCAIATAWHVVSAADEWQQPIRIHNHDFTKTVFLKETDRVVFRDIGTDLAVIFLQAGKLDLPQEIVQLRPIESPLSIGAEVGWLGFPGIEPYTLCFFSGNISARREDRIAYLVDGVAINGVSGGPVFYTHDGVDHFVGAVSAYRINRQFGEALPGLLVAQDVSHFHAVVQKIRTFDEAVKKRQAQEQASASPGQPPQPEGTVPDKQTLGQPDSSPPITLPGPSGTVAGK